MAPEYAIHGHISVKSDVFSFGVLLLEIVSGQRNGSFRDGENLEHLLSYVSTHFDYTILIYYILMCTIRPLILFCTHIYIYIYM